MSPSVYKNRSMDPTRNAEKEMKGKEVYHSSKGTGAVIKQKDRFVKT